jgi:hypothetical protein
MLVSARFAGALIVTGVHAAGCCYAVLLMKAKRSSLPAIKLMAVYVLFIGAGAFGAMPWLCGVEEGGVSDAFETCFWILVTVCWAAIFAFPMWLGYRHNAAFD